MARKLEWDEQHLFTQALLESEGDAGQNAEEAFMRVMSQKRDLKMEMSNELRHAFDHLLTRSPAIG